jgi:hypothetical protein
MHVLHRNWFVQPELLVQSRDNEGSPALVPSKASAGSPGMSRMIRKTRTLIPKARPTMEASLRRK